MIGGARRWPKRRAQSRSQGAAQGQWAGRCSTGRRCGRAIRAGTVTICRRRVAPRATACFGLVRVPAARSRLWLIAAQIAQALFISPRTVEGNLARVYRKLNIRSRAELGARLKSIETIASQT